MSSKDQLMALERGTYESQHWKEAEDLLNELQTNPKLPLDKVRKHVRAMFEILDRLADEKEWMKQQDASNEKLDMATVLTQKLLNHALDSWFMYIKSKTNRRQLMYAKRKRAQGGQWKLGNAALDRNLLGPKTVLSKIDRYFHLGLFQKTTVPYCVVVRGMNKVDDPQHAPYEAHKIYKMLIEKSDHDPNDRTLHPDKRLVYDMIEIWAQSWLPESYHRTEEYLMSLKDWCKKTNHKMHRPHTDMYCAIMQTHGRSNKPNAALTRIQDLFAEMKQKCPSDELDVGIYNRVCHALVECSSIGAIRVAHVILNDMCDAVLDKESQIPRPNASTFSLLITAYVRSGRSDEAEKLFDRMEQLTKATGAEDLRQPANNYIGLISAYAEVGDNTRAELVAKRLNEAMGNGEISTEEGKLTVIWDRALVAWARSIHPDARVFFCQWIQRLLKYSVENQLPGKITIDTLNNVLRNFASIGTVKGAMSAETLLKWMENQDNSLLKRNSSSYLQHILAWCKAGKPHEAETSLRRVCENIYDETSLINPRCFISVIDAWASTDHPQRKEKARGIIDLMETMKVSPNRDVYNSLVRDWARTKRLDMSETLLKMFDKMKQQWKDGDESAKPSGYTYSTVIWTLCQSRESTKLEHAEKLLYECEQDEVQPTFHMYNSLMSGWMSHLRPDKVESLFEEMKDGYVAGNEALKPTNATHITRLQAWSKAGSPEKTSEALNDWIVAGEAESFVDIPGTHAFNAVLVAWLRSNRSSAAENAHKWLQQMTFLASSGRFECFPDCYSFTVVISAYVNSRSTDADKKALQLLEEFKSISRDRHGKSFDPDLFMYVDVIVACFGFLNIENGDEAVRSLFAELLSKEAAFWLDEDMDDDGLKSRLLRKLRSVFELSRFRHDELLKLQLERVESTAKHARRGQVGVCR